MSTVDSLENRWSVSFADPILRDDVDSNALQEVHTLVEERQAPDGGGTALAVAPLELQGALAELSKVIIAQCTPCGHWFTVAGR
jgi:hypothetical protein